MSPLWIVLALLPILGGAERFNCRGRILGAYYADVKAGCKAFHVCVKVAGGGVRDFRFYCPPGTLFHQEAQTCTDWGDDDPLACPADIYDGQFDLYKIGSVYDTKKLSSSVNREEETEFGLQRAETGDRRLSQNNVVPNAGASDLRTAHSSDFFSGQRERGRDEPVAQTQPPVSVTQFRQSFRRPTTARTTPTSTQYTTPAPTLPPQTTTSNQLKYYQPKRKSIRKRPVYVSTSPPHTDAPRVNFQTQTYSEESQQDFNRRPIPDNKQIPLSVNIPAKYKDEYIEVSKVAPKQSRFFANNQSPNTFSPSTQAPTITNNDGLVELYNYEAQSTPGFRSQNENKFKVRNNFNVEQSSVSKEPDFLRTRNFNYNADKNIPTSTDFSLARSSSTPDYRNFNSVSYEPEKNNFVKFSGSKQNYFTSPSTTSSTTTFYTTTRTDNGFNVNTVAYNTNLGFNTVSSHFGESIEDDGQYRPPQGEDDGQYRPELYERDAELLSGAHSLNIAASGNRLPEDQKPSKAKLEKQYSKIAAIVPRPFRPAPTPFTTSTTLAPETYPTTIKSRIEQTSQRVFDYYQPYTTTSRPHNLPSAPEYALVSTITPSSTSRIITEAPVRSSENTKNRGTGSTAIVPQVTRSTQPPHFANPTNKKEDASYDYAYYDTDPGFSEYDHIEEFSRTKSKV